MRKNFFKKLSFVLALAMIVSVIAPAAGVFADTGLKLNSKDKTLHLAQPGKKNKFNFNIDGEKQKGWKYLWISSNEDVAEVNEKNGVTTAVGTGTAEITVVITDKNGAEVDRLTAKVTVKDNIKTVAIKNPPTEPIPVGEEYDFDRSFVTYSGSTTKTTAVTRWFVEGDNKEAAEINDENGLFKASEGGTYTVVARSFQSKAKYEEWKATGDASLVLDDASAEVTVKAGIKEVKQINTSKIQVVFDSNMSKTDVKTKSVIYRYVGNTKISTGAEQIKSIELSEDGKIVTIELYAKFEPAAQYGYEFGDLAQTFKTASTKIEDVAGLIFEDFNVDMTQGEDASKYVYAVDENGVIILDAAALGSRLSYSYDGEDKTKAFVAGSTVYIYEEGFKAPITVKYNDFVYNETTKQYQQKSYSKTAIATGYKPNTNVNTGTIQFLIDQATAKPDTNSSAWGLAHNLAANDGLFYFHARYKLYNDNDKYYYSDDAGTEQFTYESSDPQKLLINSVTIGGKVYYTAVPLAQGNVTVLVKNSKGEVVTTFGVTVMGQRTFVGLTQSTNYITLGNINQPWAETDEVVLTATDSMGTNFVPNNSDVLLEVINKPSNPEATADDVAHLTTFASISTGGWVEKIDDASNGQFKLKFQARGITPGPYTIKVKVTKYGVTKEVYFVLNVVEAKATDAVASWKVQVNATTVDKKENTGTTLNVDIFGLNAAGMRVAKFNNSEYAIEVYKGSSQVTKNVSGSSIGVVVADSDSKLDFYEDGTYMVLAKLAVDKDGKKAGSVIGSVTFEVKDSTSKEVSVQTTAVDVTGTDSLLNVFKAAFKVKLNGNEIDYNNITAFNVSDGSSALTNKVKTDTVNEGTNLFVDSITYEVANSNNTKTVYTFDVKRLVTLK